MVIRGERVKQARELKVMTQAALAKAVGVSQAAIAQIESGDFLAWKTCFKKSPNERASRCDSSVKTLHRSFRWGPSCSDRTRQ